MQTQLVYSKNYDFSFGWLEKLHPFDAKKFSKAWSLLQGSFDGDISQRTTFITAPVTDEELEIVHSKSYLSSLSSSASIAKIIEIPALKFLPNFFLQKSLVTPAKYAVAGTLCAARLALDNAMVFNLGGGFHHAFFDHGEGFCFFADAAFALEVLKKENRLAIGNTVLMIDLDAHRGNGFASYYEDNESVGIFDLYNMQAYPGLKDDPEDQYPFTIPLRAGVDDQFYLDLLNTEFMRFLDAHKQPKLAFYNAGTDVLASDKLGGLNVSYDGVLERDRFIIDQLYARNIPTVIMTSGGYSKDSYKLIAELANYLLAKGK